MAGQHVRVHTVRYPHVRTQSVRVHTQGSLPDRHVALYLEHGVVVGHGLVGVVGDVVSGVGNVAQARAVADAIHLHVCTRAVPRKQGRRRRRAHARTALKGVQHPSIPCRTVPYGTSSTAHQRAPFRVLDSGLSTARPTIPSVPLASRRGRFAQLPRAPTPHPASLTAVAQSVEQVWGREGRGLADAGGAGAPRIHVQCQGGIRHGAGGRIRALLCMGGGG